MRPQKAIQALRALKEEGSTPKVMDGDAGLTAWRGKVHGVLAASLGQEDALVKKFDVIRFHLSAFSPRTPQHEFDNARHRGVREACGLIDAAIFQLELSSEGEEVVDESSFDPELWSHVANHVQDEQWTTVASQTAIFVEDRLRRWAGKPKSKHGDGLYGKTLYAKVLGAGSEFQLGNRSGESEGWLMLGMGFAQALGNVDRHNIQNRDDARRYAIGVLGLGSLLLTQLRYEHAELIAEAEELSPSM